MRGFSFTALPWRLTVDADPGAAFIDLDVHNRVNLPQRLAGLIQLLRVFLIEQQPAANAYMLPLDRGDGAVGPAAALIAHTRRDLDHHRLRLRRAGRQAKPDMEVAVIGGVAVG